MHTLRLVLPLLPLLLFSGCTAVDDDTAADDDTAGDDDVEQVPDPITAATVTVGASGGAVESGGVSITVPAGALAADVEIVLGPAPAGLPALPEGLAASGPGIEVQPHGTAFVGAPATIVLPVGEYADTILRLADADATTWEVVAGAQFADGVATFATYGFSFYVPASRCSATCSVGQGASCAGQTGLGSCVSTCQANNLPNQVCPNEAAALAACYVNAPVSGYGCGQGFGWPLDTTCATEAAAVAACVTGVSLPSPCDGRFGGLWYMTPFSQDPNEFWVKVIGDRVIFVTEDAHHNGGFSLNCTSSTTIESPQGVCGWDEGSTADLTLNTTGTQVTADFVYPSGPPTNVTRTLIRPTSAEPTWLAAAIATMATTPIPSSCP